MVEVPSSEISERGASHPAEARDRSSLVLGRGDASVHSGDEMPLIAVGTEAERAELLRQFLEQMRTRTGERNLMPLERETFEDLRLHRAELQQRLAEVVSIQSISTLPEHAGDITQAAEFFSNQLKAAGFEDIQLTEQEYEHGRKTPLLFASDMSAGPDKPTVLIYGHFDVQPIDDAWETTWDGMDPFTLTEKDGKLYGRGVIDDKGPVLAVTHTLQSLRRANGGKLPLNVKVIYEGGEEIGSKALDLFVPDHADMLKADAILVTDTGMLETDKVNFTTSTRGNTSFEVQLERDPNLAPAEAVETGPFKEYTIVAHGPQIDVHSGSFGGVAPNPIQGLMHYVAYASDHLSPDARVRFGGFAGGYTGEGSKTAIPSEESVRVQIYGDDPEAQLAELQRIASEYQIPGVTLEFKPVEGPTEPIPADSMAVVLSKVMSSMKDVHNEIQVPGIYDDVIPPADAEMESMAQSSQLRESQLVEVMGSGDKIVYPSSRARNVIEANTSIPTLDIHGIRFGDSSAKITCRQVPGMDPDKSIQQILDHIQGQLPPGVTMRMIAEPEGSAAMLSRIDNPYMQIAIQAGEAQSGKGVVFLREGGSIPVLKDMSETLQAPLICLGVAEPTSNEHAPRENISTDNLLVQTPERVASFLIRLAQSQSGLNEATA